jgi:hypothetical protein
MRSKNPSPVRDSPIVVLLAQEALGATPDLAALVAALAASQRPVRALIRVIDSAGLEFAMGLQASCTAARIPADLLLGAAVKLPDDLEGAARMPPGSPNGDLDELALLLADVVLATPGAAEQETVRKLLADARAAGKPICPPGCGLLCVATPVASVTHRLDPLVRGWPAWGRRWGGRLEQVILEVLSFGWQEENGRAHSRKKLHACLFKPWVHTPYFAPETWRTLVPDSAVLPEGAPLITEFERLDRCALYGSYVHRDLIWVLHLAAACAVLSAVFGSLFSPDGWVSSTCMVIELVLLALIAGLIYAARRVLLQDRWTACRLAAEQLRIARMCLPLMVVPPALTVVEAAAGEARDFSHLALAEVQRVVRDQGLPRLQPEDGPVKAARWLHLIVSDQAQYHKLNHRKLEHAERRLGWATATFFGLAVLAVLAHFRWETEWLLLCTAAGPAFAAALHGAETRLGIKHRAGLSEEVHRQLVPIAAVLDAFIAAPPATPEAGWLQVRGLARRAAREMGQENQSWHRLVRRERDTLPA